MLNRIYTYIFIFGHEKKRPGERKHKKPAILHMTSFSYLGLIIHI